MFKWQILLDFMKTRPVKKESTSIFEDWKEANNIKEMCNYCSYDVPKFIKTGRNNLSYSNSNRPPFADHCEEYRDKNKNVFFVYHPYYGVEDIEDTVNEWAEANGVKAEFFDTSKSWYNPGSTCLVVIRKKD